MSDRRSERDVLWPLIDYANDDVARVGSKDDNDSTDAVRKGWLERLSNLAPEMVVQGRHGKEVGAGLVQ